MGRVILGAVIGALVGLVIGAIPSYSQARWEVYHSAGHFTLELARLLHPLSMMIGTAAGSVVGAIAGRTAADPASRPLPRWFIIAFFVVLFGVLGLTLLAGIYWTFARSSARPQPAVPGEPNFPDAGPGMRQMEKAPGP